MDDDVNGGGIAEILAGIVAVFAGSTGWRMKPRLKAAHVSPQRAVHGTHLRGLGYGEQGAAWLPEMLLESLPELPGIWFLIWRCIACA